MATLISMLNTLAESGQLGTLYAAGVVNLKTYNYRDVYLYYQALRSTPRYVDHVTQAVEETARQCGVSKETVYRAMREMEQDV